MIEESKIDEDAEYGHYTPQSLRQRNRILSKKYGFEIDYNDGNLYYNADLRSFSGFVEYDEDDCSDFVIHTTKFGISPVGSDAKKVRNIINDAMELNF